MRKFLIWTLVYTMALLMSQPCLEASINLSLVSKIESSDNPNAFNKRSKARGLFQITPICLKHYNSVHHSAVSEKELFDPEVNQQIAEWYFSWLTEQLGDDTDSLLIAYNWGIGNFRKWNGSFQSLPQETRKYLTKYHILENKSNELR